MLFRSQHHLFPSHDIMSIEKYLIQEDVYQYKSKDELTDILAALNEPIIDGSGKKMVLSKDFGIVFYWSEIYTVDTTMKTTDNRVYIKEWKRFSFSKNRFEIVDEYIGDV